MTLCRIVVPRQSRPRAFTARRRSRPHSGRQPSSINVTPPRSPLINRLFFLFSLFFLIERSPVAPRGGHHIVCAVPPPPQNVILMNRVSVRPFMWMERGRGVKASLTCPRSVFQRPAAEDYSRVCPPAPEELPLVPTDSSFPPAIESRGDPLPLPISTPPTPSTSSPQSHAGCLKRPPAAPPVWY